MSFLDQMQHAERRVATGTASSASVTNMAERIRRPRGSTQKNPVVFGHVSPEAKAVLNTAADTLGISSARAIELILLTLPLDPDGVPIAIDRNQYTREELPISAA
jgi:hypothetical protein